MARFQKYAYSGKGGFIEPTPETFEAISEAIRWAEEEVPMQLNSTMLRLTQFMAMYGQGEARKMSFGPEDPTGKVGVHHQLMGRSFIGAQSGPSTPVPHVKSSPTAWKIPVRRITGAYYLGWKVRPVRGGWQVYNDSREAYFIEFGINHLGAGRRVRRPIRKMAFMRTLERVKSPTLSSKVWADIVKHRGRGAGFTVNTQSAGMGSFTGPMLGRTLV